MRISASLKFIAGKGFNTAKASQTTAKGPERPHPAFSNLEILAGSFSVCIPSGLRFRLSGVHSMFLLRDICLYLDELSDGFKEIDSFVD